MWQAAFIIFISCCLSGIFTGTNMLKRVEDLLMKAEGRFSLFVYNIIVSTLTAAFGCNQSISSVLTYNLLHKSYEKNEVDNYKLALGKYRDSIIGYNSMEFSSICSSIDNEFKCSRIYTICILFIFNSFYKFIIYKNYAMWKI